VRREGYELQVSRPQVIYKEIDGARHEPVEYLVMDVDEEYVGAVIQGIGKRRGELKNMGPSGVGQVRLEFEIPARGLMGYRTEFLTQTRGAGVMNHTFLAYQPYKGDLPHREQGVLISLMEGESVTYGLYNIQERGGLFIGTGVPLYEGMIIGEHSRGNDLVVNACKKKQLTNMRASGTDEALILTPPRILSLEQSLEFLADDELLEVTPKSLRLRKRYLTENERKRMSKK
jgi:GTP-binding protein